MIKSYYNIIHKYMTTLSVPIQSNMEEALNTLVKNGRASNKAELVRNAISLMLEEEAIQSVLRAQAEPALSGDLRELSKKFI